MTEPPLGDRLYYYLGFRLPVQYRDWVEADIASPTYAWRNASWRVGSLVLAAVVVAAVTAIGGEGPASPGMLFGALTGAAVLFPVMVALGKWQGRRALQRHHRLWGVTDGGSKS